MTNRRALDVSCKDKLIPDIVLVREAEAPTLWRWGHK